MSRGRLPGPDQPRFTHSRTLFLRLLLPSAPLLPTVFSPLLPMGRNSWATTEQTKFLEEHFANLERENQDYPLTVIYAQVAAIFIQRWPSPLPQGDKYQGWTHDQLKAQGNIARKQVSFFIFASPIFAEYSSDSRSLTGSRGVARPSPLNLPPRLFST